MKILVVLLLSNTFIFSCIAQTFTHPGIDQTAKDLDHMRQQVLKGTEPYKSAFNRLKAITDSGFRPIAHTHVLRGPYGRPNIGGDDLSRSANMAYNNALVWYITKDKRYANNAIEILNAWSPVLWHFDYNDAKLLAAWTGHMLCNAAEILRYTNAGWQQKDINAFSNMLMTAYYPLMRYYYPAANGNWDGAIIHSIMAIGIFTDNRIMFDNAVDHFVHAPVNGSLFKYIYPSGQCQETMRDQGHVQLGLGEFAGAAQVAFTQGVDLFSIGNNRLGLGYEYTASFLLGEMPHSYGRISERAKALRDDYESVYRHYASLGINLPYTKRAADSVRSKANRSILSAVRAPSARSVKISAPPTPSPIGYIAGAGAAGKTAVPPGAITVKPGDSIQLAIDEAVVKKGWVQLTAGIHRFPSSLRIPSNVTISGEGIATVLFMDPGSSDRDALVNADNDMHDVTIRNLLIEGSPRTEVPSDPNSVRSYRGGYNRGGIIFRSLRDGQMKSINLINVTIQNCTYNGVFISGGENIQITGCDFTENGGSVVPGPKLQHNLLLTHCINVKVKDSRLDTSPFGAGIALDHCNGGSVTNTEIARNGYYGVLVSECKDITIANNLIEGNDRSGVMIEFLQKGSDNVTVSNNIIQFNNGYAIESYAASNSKMSNNTSSGNGTSKAQQKVSAERVVFLDDH